MSSAVSATVAIAYLRVGGRAAGRGAGAGGIGAESDAHEEAAQRSAIEAWASREHVDVRAWKLDLGVSSETPIAERPALLAAYAAIREHRAGVLVAANAERFTKDELVAWLIERAAITEGAALRTADGSAISARPSRGGAEKDDSDQGEAAFTRGAVEIARAYQRVVIRERTRAALADKKSRGERVGAVPYGYRLSADGIHLEQHAAEQTVLGDVRRLSGEGLSQRAIVAHLEANGVAGRTGAPLQQTQIARMLRPTG